MQEDARDLLDRINRSPQKEARPVPERRYIFGGGRHGPVPPPAAVPRQNRRVARRRYSTFNTIAMVFAAGLVIVLYVNNILTINQLAADVGRLQAQYAVLQNLNASLRAEVNRKSSWERIGSVATDQLGLVFPREQPAPLTIDESTLRRVTNR
jgi:cell division protein FtsL